MNREQILLKAVADVIKDRMAPRRTVALSPHMTAEIPMPEIPPVDLAPLAAALASALDRQAYGMQEAIRQLAEMPKQDYAAKVDVPAIDVTPIAEALRDCFDRQTDMLEKMLGKFLKEMKDDRAVKFTRDASGKITGARRTND